MDQLLRERLQRLPESRRHLILSKVQMVVDMLVRPGRIVQAVVDALIVQDRESVCTLMTSVLERPCRSLLPVHHVGHLMAYQDYHEAVLEDRGYVQFNALLKRRFAPALGEALGSSSGAMIHEALALVFRRIGMLPHLVELFCSLFFYWIGCELTEGDWYAREARRLEELVDLVILGWIPLAIIGDSSTLVIARA